MNVDLTYDGQAIKWNGKDTFKATSGLPGSQQANRHCVPDSGPIPEGLYYLFLSDKGEARDDDTGQCALKPAWGMQILKVGYPPGGSTYGGTHH